MNSFSLKLIHLAHCRAYTPALYERMSAISPDLRFLYDLSAADLRTTFRMSHRSAVHLHEDLRRLNPCSILKDYEKKGVYAIPLNDALYPPMLKEIHQPPIVLFVAGDTGLLKAKSVAVVGARKASSYAAEALSILIPPLAEAGYSIVSGLAAGTDAMAHRIAAEAGGRTAAVLGGGFRHIYPREHVSLAAKLAAEHALISEYPPHIRPEKWHFPMRNRIISGMSLGVVIAEANERSGSLITADRALEEGREVFAVPGQITSPLSAGCNRLIQQGAKLVLSAEDIMEELP